MSRRAAAARSSRRSTSRREPPQPPSADEAWARLLNWLALSPRSEQEIARRVRRWGLSDSDAVALVERARSARLLDDAALATALAAELGRKGLWGRAISQRLATRGIDRAIVDQAVQDACDEQAVDRARRVAARRLRPGADPRAEARRLVSYLQRRGFSLQDALRAVRDVIGSDVE